MINRSFHEGKLNPSVTKGRKTCIFKSSYNQFDKVMVLKTGKIRIRNKLSLIQIRKPISNWSERIRIRSIEENSMCCQILLVYFSLWYVCQLPGKQVKLCKINSIMIMVLKKRKDLGLESDPDQLQIIIAPDPYLRSPRVTNPSESGTLVENL
jgi:hypothetical protein